MTVKSTSYFPGLTLGIVGGGQLGRMMIFEAKKLGLKVVIMDPNSDCPAGQVADEQITADFKDMKGYQALAKKSDVVTFEFEHVSVKGLKLIEKENIPVNPGSHVLTIIQNKDIQKQYLKENGVLVPDFQVVTNYDEFKNTVDEIGLPVMAKLCQGGYDGKGNFLIKSQQDFETIKTLLDKHDKLLIEKYIKFQKELSIMAAKSANGDTIAFPTVENVHKDEILRLTKAPANINSTAYNKVTETSLKILESLKEPGIYGIEFFLLQNGQVSVNEIAPRVHNSGHYTIEACDICQFSVHLRAILGLPLYKPTLEVNAWMYNLLGTSEGQLPIKDFNKIFEQEGVYLHLYGKEELRPNRKVGHINITGRTEEFIKNKISNLELIDKEGVLDEL